MTVIPGSCAEVEDLEERPTFDWMIEGGLPCDEDVDFCIAIRPPELCDDEICLSTEAAATLYALQRAQDSWEVQAEILCRPERTDP